MLVQVSLSLFAMIGSTHTHTQGSGARSSSQTLEPPASVSKNTPCIAQVNTPTPLPNTPTLSILEIQVTPAPTTSNAKVSKRERFKASVKGAFHKSDGSLLPSKNTTTVEDKPKLSKRERLSQIFTTEKSKAQTIYFEEGHPLLAPKAKDPSNEKKLSKRKRLSQLLKTDKQLAKEAYYADESPPTPKSQRKPRPQSQILPKSLDQRLASPPSSRRNSLDTPALTTQAHPQTPISPALSPPRLEIFPYPSQEDNLPPRSETKALESPEHTPPGSLQDLLRQNTQLTPPPPSQFSFFEDLEKSLEDPLLAEARAFRDNKANYSIEASKSSPALNPCCQDILEGLSAHIQKLSGNSIPNALSAPALAQPVAFSAILPVFNPSPREHPKPQALKDSQISKTDTTITVDLDHFKHDKKIGLEELSQLLAEFIKYSGLVGDLMALGKHTWVLTHTHASMTLYICPKRMGCRPSSLLSSIVESNRNNKGVIYKEVNSQTLRNARKLSTPYTLAYAQSIRKNLHLKSTLAKFIGSCIAVSGIFTVLLSNAISQFHPNVAFSIYGYYLISISIALFVITQFCKTAHTQCLSLRESKQMNIYRELLKQNENTYAYGSIQNLAAQNNTQASNALQEQTIELIQSNFDFTLRHILESLKVEQERPLDAEALFPAVLPDPNPYIHNPDGPTYIFLKATLGIKKATLNLLLKEYKKDELKARHILHELLLDSKMLSS